MIVHRIRTGIEELYSDPVPFPADMTDTLEEIDALLKNTGIITGYIIIKDNSIIYLNKIYRNQIVAQKAFYKLDSSDNWILKSVEIVFNKFV